MHLIESIEAHLNDGRKGERLRDGVQIVILGSPNAGKSSLFNTFCKWICLSYLYPMWKVIFKNCLFKNIGKRPKAIISEVPGTTRDIIDAALNLDGYNFVK